MHIAHLTIKNFRALDDIHTDLTPRINVIVGPNAVGKTTILQALRLAKGVLAPRTQGESQHILYSLGAASPNLPERFLTNALFRHEERPLEIRCTYRLTDKEIETL
jgi:AAA15 family ATPase/GTPase